MNRLYWTLGIMVVLAVASSAQVKPVPPDYEQPVDRQWDTGQCHELMVKKLYAATDEADPLQEGYLRSAEAYRLLAESGQGC